MNRFAFVSLALVGCTHLVVVDGELDDAGNPIEPTGDAHVDGKAPGDAAADAKTDGGSANDSGVMVDSGKPPPQDSGAIDTGIDSGAPDSGVSSCVPNNQAFKPRICDGTAPQDFTVIESCGQNCTIFTPCAQKKPHCPNGDTCKFLDMQQITQYGVCAN